MLFGEAYQFPLEMEEPRCFRGGYDWSRPLVRLTLPKPLFPSLSWPLSRFSYRTTLTRFFHLSHLPNKPTLPHRRLRLFTICASKVTRPPSLRPLSNFSSSISPLRPEPLAWILSPTHPSSRPSLGRNTIYSQLEYAPVRIHELGLDHPSLLSPIEI